MTAHFVNVQLANRKSGNLAKGLLDQKTASELVTTTEEVCNWKEDLVLLGGENQSMDM